MNTRLLILLSLFGVTALTTSNLQAQTVNDTTNHPYWIEMMSDPTVNFYKTQRAFELYWQNRTIEKGSGYKPFKRWEYNISEIVDANGNIPAPGYLEAEVQKYKNRYYGTSGGGVNLPGLAGAGASCLTEGNWKEIGPNYLPGNRTGQPNGLGRINGLAFHPTDSNKIFAGAPAGGLWVSTDGGQTWSTNTDTLATLGVSSIAIDPYQPDTIYLGTGDRDASDSYGRGVMKSTDGGANWFNSNSGMGNVVVGRMIIDPTNTSILLAATSGGIYRTTDGGNSWSRMLTGNCEEILFDAVNTDFVFSAIGNKFYRSTDNGQNWTQITSGFSSSGINRMVVGVTPADSNFVYVLATASRVFEGLYLSTDRGVTFTQMSNSPNIMDYSHLGSGTSGQAWYDLDVAVDPVDKSIVYSAGVNIFQSIDSGKTWKINAHWVGSGGAPDVHADNHVLEYQPNTNTLFTGNDGGVYYTKNRGTSWIDISTGLGVAQIYRLGQSAKTPDMIINGYQDNGTGLLEAGAWYTVLGGDGMDCVIDPQDDAYAYSDLYYGDIRRYKNGSYNGSVAKNGTNGVNESGGWVTPFILHEADPNRMIAGYKNVWRAPTVRSGTIAFEKISDNLGGSNTNNITVLENSIADPEKLYVARSDNKFFVTSNLTATTPTWTEITSSLPASGGIQWVESHNTLGNRLWICLANKIFQSDDGGSNWTNISNGLPNIPILTVVLDTSSALQGMYLGTYMGVFYKDTTMSSWQWFNKNMPTNTRVRDVELYYSPSGRDKSHVVCATYGRGNWRSPIYDEDQNIPVAEFSASESTLCLYNTVAFADTSSNLPTQWLWRISPAGGQYINGTDSCSQFPTVRFNVKGKYTVELVVANCMGADSVTKTESIEVFDAIKTVNCTTVTKNIGAYGIAIYGVDIHDYSNTSGGVPNEGMYVDRACKDIIQLKADTAYLTSITTGTSYDEYVKIYIDFNNNGDLTDAGEMVYATPRNRTTHVDSIRIPKNPTTNTILRMRIMSDFDTIRNPCDSLRYGQTEDYGVVIERRIPKPYFVSDTNRICKGGQIVLTDSSEGSIYNQKWVVSKYGLLTYSSDSAGPITFTLPDTGWYYAQLYLNDSLVNYRIDSVVYVQPIPITTLSVSQGKLVSCEGDAIGLKASMDYPSTSTLNWFKNNVSISGAQDSLLNISPIAMLDSGYYKVVVNRNGCGFTSDSLKLSVRPKPVADFTINLYNQCFNTQDFVFTNASTISSGSNTYNWDFGNGSGSAMQDPSFIYSDTGSYNVRLIANGNGTCYDTAVQSVVVIQNPVAGFTVNNDVQCFKNHSFQLSNTSDAWATSWKWSFGNGTSSTQKHDTVLFGVEGLYTVELVAVSNQGCTDTMRSNLTLNASPTSDFIVSVIAPCLSNNEFDYTNTSSITTGSIAINTWDLGDGSSRATPSVNGHSYATAGSKNVRLIVQSNAGCADTSIQTANVLLSPTASFSINDSVQCLSGNSVVLDNSSSIPVGFGATYNWDFGDGSSTPAGAPLPHTYATEGSYVVEFQVHSNNSCSDTLQKTMVIDPSPIVDFTGGVGCVGTQIDFVNNTLIAFGTLDKFAWDFGDGATSILTAPSHIYAKPGVYEVKLVVESNKGCKDSSIYKSAAEIFANPTADYTYAKTASFGTTTELSFTDVSIGASVWFWQFGSQENSTDPNPIISFTDTGTIAVQLAVSSAEGCVDTITKYIFVFPESTFYIPNSFSPNGDEINDRLNAVGVLFVQEFKLQVFNRWGEQMFETTKAQEGWDGTYKGELASAGFYIVVIEYKDFNNNLVRQNMRVYLMR